MDCRETRVSRETFSMRCSAGILSADNIQQQVSNNEGPSVVMS
jgi:hypothetical protein